MIEATEHDYILAPFVAMAINEGNPTAYAERSGDEHHQVKFVKDFQSHQPVVAGGVMLHNSYIEALSDVAGMFDQMFKDLRDGSWLTDVQRQSVTSDALRATPLVDGSFQEMDDDAALSSVVFGMLSNMTTKMILLGGLAGFDLDTPISRAELDLISDWEEMIQSMNFVNAVESMCRALIDSCFLGVADTVH